jgi:hypothetical protein
LVLWDAPSAPEIGRRLNPWTRCRAEDPPRAALEARSRSAAASTFAPESSDGLKHHARGSASRRSFCTCEHDGYETQAAHRTSCYRWHRLVILRLGDSAVCAVPARSSDRVATPGASQNRNGTGLRSLFPAAAAGQLQTAAGERGVETCLPRASAKSVLMPANGTQS